MAHLSSYENFESVLNDADELYTADITAMNSSGVSGTVLFAVDYDENGGGTLSVSVGASGLAADQMHMQHIHGTFDADGNPTDATTPTIALDSDLDGQVEVLEGLAAYGDVLLPLGDMNGATPMSDSQGNLSYFMEFDITDDALFFSPVTGAQYSFEDIADLILREYVIHGVTVPAGIGAGTGGEVDGSGGYEAILPAGAAEIEAIDLDTALFLSDQQSREAGDEYRLSGADDTFSSGAGMDTVRAGEGADTVDGGGDADAIVGGSGEDMLTGGSGDDAVVGGAGDDMVSGDEGDDVVKGNGGDDTVMGGDGDDSVWGNGGDDSLDGGAGDDAINGAAGDDSLFGQDGDDQLKGGDGDDLIVGGNGEDIILGGSGDDIFGGLAGDDKIKGGEGMDEFHFDAGTGTDQIADFTQGEDVISFLQDGAISFANSAETAGRGDSDLSADDFDFVSSYAELDGANDQQVVYSGGGIDDLSAGAGGAAVEAYIAATNGNATAIYYDDDWSTLEGRETIAVLNSFSAEMTVSEFDVY